MMTVDVEFGVAIERLDEDGPYTRCEWPGKGHDENFDYYGTEDDGTSIEYTIFAGRPHRSYATHGFYDWIERIPEAATLVTACKRPNSNDFTFAKLDDTIMHLIDLLPLSGEPCDIDRAKWYKYWAKRAKDEFGDKAIIAFW
jgi:hypothetical protein